MLKAKLPTSMGRTDFRKNILSLITDCLCYFAHHPFKARSYDKGWLFTDFLEPSDDIVMAKEFLNANINVYRSIHTIFLKSAHYSLSNWNSAACCRCTFNRCHNWRTLMLLPLAASPQKAPLAGSLYPQHRVSSDEDPYSLSPAESSGSSGKGLRQTRWGHHVSRAEHGVKYIPLKSGLKRRI